MAFTVKIPTSFDCPPDDIFSLPTKQDIVNAISKLAQIPSKLRVEMVKMGEELTAEVKEQIEDVIKTIEELMDNLAKILSPYWKKGQTRNWQKEINDAITEFIQEFHIYVPTKIAELIAKIIPISLKVTIFGISIDCARIFDPTYQKELQDQIAGMGPEYMAKLEKLKQDLLDGILTPEEYKEQLLEMANIKSKITDAFYKLLPENMRGWGSQFGVQCDEWKAKMTWQYIKTEIQEFLTGGLFKVFGKLIGKFDKIWKLLGLPNLSALVGGDLDVGAMVDALIKSLVKKRDKILKKLQDPNLLSDAKEKLLKELTEAGTAITDAIGKLQIFGFDVMKIIGGKIDTTVISIEEQVIEFKLALKEFVANWRKKLLFEWVVVVKKFFSAIGLGGIFKPLFFTLCNLMKLIGFPPAIPSIGAIAGVMGVSELVKKVHTYVPNKGDDTGVAFSSLGENEIDETSFSVATGTGTLHAFVDGVEVEEGDGMTVSGKTVTFDIAPLTQSDFDAGISKDVSLIFI